MTCRHTARAHPTDDAFHRGGPQRLWLRSSRRTDSRSSRVQSLCNGSSGRIVESAFRHRSGRRLAALCSGARRLGSSKLILTVAQPFANHKGGLNLFGPDGMLYIGLGDGGNAGDPLGNGQNRGTLLGKILRIDVDRGDPYSVPADNPFVGQQGARGEIWAYGLRNPWRFAFDRPGGLLFIADVGQARFEEVDVVAANRGGVNYGWNIMEGVSCFNSSSCNQQGLELPVITYDRSGGACSITGGFVYRGASLPEIAGHYFYSDYCAGFLKSFRYQNGSAVEQRVWDVGSIGSITSFGEDAAGELYMTSSSGRVYRIVRRS